MHEIIPDLIILVVLCPDYYLPIRYEEKRLNQAGKMIQMLEKNHTCLNSHEQNQLIYFKNVIFLYKSKTVFSPFQFLLMYNKLLKLHHKFDIKNQCKPAA